MIMDIIGIYSIPTLVAIAGGLLIFTKKDLFNEFITGCKEGISTSFKILPSLIILICATKMISASGALGLICNTLGAFTEKIGIPTEIIPVIIMRPISGSASTAMINNLFSEFGPDSFAGRCASILMGSSDTIIYTLALYFSASEIRRTRHALPSSFIVLVFCTILSVILTHIFF